jgi:hypothetical protein
MTIRKEWRRASAGDPPATEKTPPGRSRAAADRAQLLLHHYAADAQGLAQVHGQFLPAVPEWGILPPAPSTSAIGVYPLARLSWTSRFPAATIVRRGGARREVLETSDAKRRDVIERAIRDLLRAFRPSSADDISDLAHRVGFGPRLAEATSTPRQGTDAIGCGTGRAVLTCSRGVARFVRRENANEADEHAKQGVWRVPAVLVVASARRPVAAYCCRPGRCDPQAVEVRPMAAGCAL